MYLVGVRVRVRAGVGVRLKVGVRIRVRARVRGGHLVRREDVAAYLLPPLGQDLVSPYLRQRLHLRHVYIWYMDMDMVYGIHGICGMYGISPDLRRASTCCSH